MANYHIEKIAGVVGGELHRGGSNQVIRNIVTDSRKFSFPGDSLFVAIRGERNDGHKYLSGLFRQQVRNFLVQRLPEDISRFQGANFIVVKDTLRALQILTASHRNEFDLPVIGITGSNGKTILKEWLFQLMQNERVVVRSPKSYNSQVGVPLSVWQIEPRHDLAIFEAGISRPGEMEFLEPIIRPDTGVITNLGQAHQEHFSDLETKLAEKMLLFRECGTLVYCRDHKIIDDYIRGNSTYRAKRFFTWSRSGKADLQVTEVARSEGITEITAIYKGKLNAITIPFSDRASVENAVHAWAVMLTLGFDQELISAGMRELTPVAMRLEQKQGINNCTIINDSYNSDLASLDIAMDFLSRVTGRKSKTVILSDMFETGRSAGDLYCEIGNLLNREKTDQLIGVGTDVREIESYFGGNLEFYDTTEELLHNFDRRKICDSAVLLKGSRRFGFERISALLEEKTHETVLEINLNNLVRNFNYFRSLIDPRTKVMAVVKAFSYGSGGYQIANALVHNLVDYLAVAFVDEGVELRKSGISAPLMVMNPDFNDCSRIVENSLEPEIYGFRGLDLLVDVLREMGVSGYPVHIKLDTGMHRLGFGSDEIDKLCDRLANCDNLRVVSVFSHLAAADDPSHDDFTRDQIKLFRRLYEKIAERLNYPVLAHILNSAGIERFSEAQFDMVRLGIGMYGISVNRENNLSNVSTFKSVISQVKEVPSGSSIGYSRACRASGKMRIAIVPVGYADGLDRRLGKGNGWMMVKGKKVPVIGNICMDMCMIDITGIEAREGDEVTVFGDESSISDIAALLSTIPYEIFVKISDRVRRIYVQE